MHSMMTGVETIALFGGLKIAVFLAVVVLAFLIDNVSKEKKHVHGLNIMAIAFLLLAVVEFFHIMAMGHEELLPWLAEHENLHLIVQPLLAIAGLGLVVYLKGVERNIKDYR